MRPNFTHLAFHVENLEACEIFYQNYCGMKVVHERVSHGKRIIWMAEPGRESELVFVFMPGGTHQPQEETDYSHVGIALGSKTEVDQIADKARAEGCLVWEPRQEPYPVGYYCGVRDPDGRFVEFSYGQPLGPGAQALTG